MLKNLGVHFEPYDSATGRAGDFVFDRAFDKVFLEFGAVVQGPEGPKALPTFEYRVAADAFVVSPIDGVVDRIALSGSGDTTVAVVPVEGSEWFVEVDHVQDPRVAVGDIVAAGDTVGRVGIGASDAFGRTEIMIYRNLGARCPFDYFDAATVDAYREQVRRHMADWETFKDDADIYDEEAMVDAGCTARTLDA